MCMCVICYTRRKDVLPWKSTMRLISASRSRIGALTSSPPHHHRTQSSRPTEPSWENKRFVTPELVLSSLKKSQCRFSHPPVRKTICCATMSRNTMSATTRNSFQLSALSCYRSLAASGSLVSAVQVIVIYSRTFIFSPDLLSSGSPSGPATWNFTPARSKLTWYFWSVYINILRPATHQRTRYVCFELWNQSRYSPFIVFELCCDNRPRLHRTSIAVLLSRFEYSLAKKAKYNLFMSELWYKLFNKFDSL